jgi:cytochrome c-type biogenesis protein CcmH/NrfG
MTDHLDVLERLARLHADGILTDNEFQTEKTKLLAGRSQASLRKPVPDGWDDTTPADPSFWSNLKWPLIALAVLVPVLALLAWSQFSRTAPIDAAQAATGAAPAADAEVADGQAQLGICGPLRHRPRRIFQGRRHI